MPSRSLADAHPVLAEKVRLTMDEFHRRAGIPWSLLITNVWRSSIEQEALYLQGRAPLDVVNKARSTAKLPPIKEKENQRVTWTRNSKHCVRPSRAVDFAVLFDEDGPDLPIKPVIDWDDRARYRLMGRIASKYGLVWGGDFQGKPDFCHVELPEES